MTPINTTMNLRDWLLLLILSLLWGGSFFFIEVALQSFAPFTLVAVRVALAALALWLVVSLTGLAVPKSAEVWLAFLIMGLLNNAVPFGLIVWGQTHIASGVASILNATTPLFAVVVAGFFLPDEQATPLKFAGVFIGLFGVALMIGLSSFGGDQHLLAQLAILGAACSYAVAGVYGRRFRRLGVSSIVTAAGQVTGSALIMLPLALFIDGAGVYVSASLTSWLALVSLALVCTALAYVIYFRLLASAGATNLLLVTLLVPISAILLGWLFLNESLGWNHALGIGCIAIGLSCIDGRLWRRRNAVGLQPR
ncbi:DMT family transporter [Reinekea marinisedimentorum]|uniref:Threonine/homoserine efflux transporter RhtA n=1 Tax=Reinekea marinisedimentorum TaxID=230495 RepID=A0A4R3IE37_9GAMM|nr:DMT family transporter [Reinekea marinisedimentorum]TCS44046.1 threonine/homoserine efflux transporter RhtA [Reinekea marinisedimentorum]